MPVESGKSEETGSRVTRSSRRIAQSDIEDSPTTSATSPKNRKILNSISEQDADMEDGSVISLSESQLSKAPGSEETATVRRTRGRANSTLTVENVTAMNNTPVRRTTRRNSVTLDAAPSTPVVATTPGRRTRRSSVTSEDNVSVASSTMTGRPRRNVAAVAKTLLEEEEPVSSPRKTPARKRTASQSEQEATPRKTPGRKSMASVPILIEEDEEEDVIECTPQSVVVKKEVSTPQKTPYQKSIATATVSIDDVGVSNDKTDSVIVLDTSATNQKTPLRSNPPTPSTPYPMAIIKAPTPAKISGTHPSFQTPTKKCTIVLDRMTPNVIPDLSNSGLDGMTAKLDTSVVVETMATAETEETKNDSLISEASDDYLDASNVLLEINVNDAEPSKVTIDFGSRRSINRSLLVSEDKSFVETSTTPLQEDAEAEQTGDESSFKTPGRKSVDGSVVPSAKETQASHQKTPIRKSLASEEEVKSTPEKTPRQKKVATPIAIFSPANQNKAIVNDAEISVANLEVSVNNLDGDEDDESNDVSLENEGHNVSEQNADDVPGEIETIQEEEEVQEKSSPLKSTIRKRVTALSEDDVSSPCKSSPEIVQSRSKSFLDKSQTNPTKRQTIHSIAKDNSPKVNEREVLSHSWSQAVHGTPTTAIDRSLKSEQTEEVIKKPLRKPKVQDFDDDDEEDSSNEGSHNSFIIDEADEDDADSMDSEEREYIEAHEVPEDGISIGSQDSDNEQLDEEEDDNSFIVSDSETFNDLDGTGDDLDDADDDNEVKKKKTKRSVMKIVDSSDEDVPANALRQEEELSDNEDEEPSENKETEQSEDEEMPFQEAVAEESVHVSDRQVNKLLSKSVHQTGKKNKKSKLNNSLDLQSGADPNISFTSFVAKHRPKVLANSSQEHLADADVEMESPPPKPKTPKPKVVKKPAPAFDDIMSRCEIILAQANEARRLEKLQNKKEIPEELIEKKKSKREQKQLEKARRAANLLKMQQDEADKQKRKAEKKLAKKNADPAVEVTKALEHGIELLSKKTSEKPVPDKEVAPHIPDVKNKSNKTGKPEVEMSNKAKIPAEEVVPDVKPKGHKKHKQVDVPLVHEAPIEKTKKNVKSVASLESNNILVSKKIKKSKISHVTEPEPEQVEVKKQPQITSRSEMKKSKKAQKLSEENMKPTAITEPIAEKVSKKTKRTRAEPQEIIEPLEMAPPAAKKFKKTKGDTVNRKLLNILTKTTSSESEPEPQKIAKQPPTQYNVLQVRSVPTTSNMPIKHVSKKRKPIDDTPVQPQWTSAGEFVVSKIPQDPSENYSNHVAHRSAGTEFTVTTLSKKRKLKMSKSESKPVPSVVAHVAEFRAKATNSDRVKRIPSAEMLQHKKKMQAFSRC